MFKLSLTAAAALTLATQAGATSLTLQEAIGTFGAVTQSFTGNSESEGRVFIQGDANGTINVNDRVQGDNGDGFDDLIITGNVTGGSILVGNGGNATVGGSLSNTGLTLNGPVQTISLGGTLNANNFNQNEDLVVENATNLNIPDVDFASFQAESAFLESLGGAAVDASDQNNIVLGGSGVVSTSISALASGTARFDLTGLDTLIVNVSGTSGTVGVNFASFAGVNTLDAATSVVFNFFEAESLTLNSAVFGHIVAPTATVTLNSSNEGNVIAESIIANGGELHPLDFAGTIPSNNGPSNTPAPVPLPASLPLVLLGMGAFAALRRRKGA